MKVAVVNGLLANENELKKILDLVVHEFDKYDLVFDYINLSEEKLNTFSGVGTAQMDQIFNKILVSDAVIFATSIHMGNITPQLQNLFNYFEINKYKAAMQNKNVLPVFIHNSNDEITAYTILMNFFKKFNAYEVNKLFLDIPEVITDDYLDRTCNYIKTRTREFASLLVPKKVEDVEKSNVSNESINQILKSDELVYDENKLSLNTMTKEEKDVNELTNMVNDKLKVQAIVKEDEKEKDVNEITQKYKSKIEQIMQETLFGDDDTAEENNEEETIAEAIFKNQMTEKEEPKINPTEHINFKRNVEEKIAQDEEVENLDSLIARVVAKAKTEREALRDKEAEEKSKELMASTFTNTNNNAQEERAYGAFDFARVKTEDNYIEESNNGSEEFVKIIKKNDDDIKKEVDEINEIKFLKSAPKYEEEQQETLEEQVPYEVDENQLTLEDTMPEEEEEEKFEPNSIKELRKKLLDMRMQRDEIVNEVNEMKTEIEDQMKEEPTQISISKFALENFSEPHEIVPYEEKEVTTSIKEEKKMSLKDMTKNLIYLFKAPEDDKMNSLIQINVEGDEGFSLYFNIVDSKCSVFDGVNMSNDLTIYVKDENWRTILDGESSLQRAFMTGLVKVTGNFMMLSKLDNTLLAYNK